MQISGFVYIRRMFCSLVFVSSLGFRRWLETKGRRIQRSQACEILKNHGWGWERKPLPRCSVAGLGTTLRIQTGGTEKESREGFNVGDLSGLLVGMDCV